MKRSIVFYWIVVLATLIGVTLIIPFLGDDETKELVSVSELKITGMSERIITEETDAYKIDVWYPEVKICEKSVETTVNDGIKNEAEKMITDFRRDVLSDSVKIEGVKSELTSKYEVSWRSESLISIKFTDFYYVSGMAHPQTTYRVFNYDVANNRAITIQDFFLPGSAYLPSLAAAAKADIRAQLEPQQYYFEEMVIEGTAPKIDNYSTFNFDKEGITMIFGQYAVAPYAAGPVFVSIPYEKLQNINTDLISRIRGKTE